MGNLISRKFLLYLSAVGAVKKYAGGDSCPISACCETTLGVMSTWMGDCANWTNH
jgi:hypothetical protein